MNKAMLTMSAFGALMTAVMATGQADAGARGWNSCVYTTPTQKTSDCYGYPGLGGTSSAGNAIFGADKIYSTTTDYQPLGINIVFLNTTTWTSGQYSVAASVTCSQSGTHTVGWFGPFTGGNGAGNQYAACTGGAGDTVVSGYGALYIN